jgi:phospholipid/cholesterol/gamma-HCH transport system ATP-binding protein
VKDAGELQIEVRGLTMAFGENVVQRDLSFGVRRGEIFVVASASCTRGRRSSAR